MLLLAVVVAACSPSSTERTSARPDTLVLAASLPTVTALATIAPPESHRGNGGMAVSVNGLVAFVLAGKGADPRFAYVDTAGRVVARFARTGDGPGEVRAPAVVWFDGDSLAAFDLMGLRVERYDPTGRSLGRFQLRGAAMPFATLAGRLAIVAFDSSGPSIVSVDRTGEATPLLAAGDAVAESLVAMPFRETGGEDRISLPAATAVKGMLVYGDAWTYRLAWTHDGRTEARYGAGTPPRRPTEAEIAEQRRGMEGWRGPNGQPMPRASIERALEHFANTSLPQFDRRTGHGMGIDAGGRLWIPRELQDSVAWDILAPGTLLGTITLPCGGGRNRGRSVNGVFIAMECEGVNDSIPIVRIWRIKG